MQFCSRSPRGSVDWNILQCVINHILIRRSPRGSVDWNFFRFRYGIFPWLSLPTRECGLKYVSEVPRGNTNRRSPRGSVDWNRMARDFIRMDYGRSPRGSVDWNNLPDASFDRFVGSLPTRECGLKYNTLICSADYIRRSPRGSVDWNHHITSIKSASRTSLPTRECGLKFSRHPQGQMIQWVAPHAGVWIEISLLK